MLDLLFAVLLAAFPVQQPEAATPPPIKVPWTEVREHYLGDVGPFLRIETQPPAFSEIKVQTVVDAGGTVTSAVANHAGQSARLALTNEMFALAEDVVQTMHFKPFTRGGKPVSVEFETGVRLLPPELKLPTHVPFPKVEDWKSVKIELRRTSCLGACPSYRVEVHGDGTVEYEGRSFVAFPGSHRGLVPQDKVIELVKLFEKADYFSLNDKYYAAVTDLPTYVTSIEIDGRRKQVVDYAGEEVGMPVIVSHLENEIDRLSGTEKWTRGNVEPVSALPRRSRFLSSVAYRTYGWTW